MRNNIYIFSNQVTNFTFFFFSCFQIFNTYGELGQMGLLRKYGYIEDIFNAFDEISISLPLQQSMSVTMAERFRYYSGAMRLS